MAQAARLNLAHHMALSKIAGAMSLNSGGRLCSDHMNAATLSACIDLVGMGLATEYFSKGGAACFCLPSGEFLQRSGELPLPGLTCR